MKYAALFLLLLLPVSASATTLYSTSTPSISQWAYTESDSSNSFGDGAVVSGARRISFVSPGSSADFAKITYNIPGTTAGVLYTIMATSTETRSGSAFGPTRSIRVNGTDLFNSAAGGAGALGLMGTTTATSTSLTVDLYIASANFGGGVNNSEDWTNVLVTFTQAATASSFGVLTFFGWF